MGGSINTRIGLAAVGLVAVAATVYLALRPGVMPLDDATLEKFQMANAEAVEQLFERKTNLADPLVSATAFRLAVEELGYSADKTLDYWLSDRFREELAAGNPAEVITRRRLVDSLLAKALGDGLSDELFAQILAAYSDEVQHAARKRRNPSAG